MTKEEREIMDIKFSRVYAEFSANKTLENTRRQVLQENFDRLFKLQSKIYDEQRKTNGRVTKLEKKTSVASYMQGHPIICIVILFAIAYISQLIEFSKVITYISKIF